MNNLDGHKPLTYAASGVDIEAGEAAVSKIREKVQATFSREVISDIGGFAGMFAPDLSGIADPVLVSSTDGVGTKAMVAKWAGKYDSIGIDLVAMCVDDLVCTGARPLFMLDYISIGKLDPSHIEQIVSGIAAGCQLAGTSLIGGEMAEHPGVMEEGDFDLAGFAVGLADRGRIWGSHRVKLGDRLIGLASPNLRSNGFSLARAALFGEMAENGIRDLGTSPNWNDSGKSLFEILLEPSVIYSAAISSVVDRESISSCAHITGGGIVGNLPRSLPEKMGAEIDLSLVEVPGIFTDIKQAGSISDEEMYRVFNMGVGMVLVVNEKSERKVRDHLEGHSIQTFALGEVVDNGGEIRIA